MSPILMIGVKLLYFFSRLLPYFFCFLLLSSCSEKSTLTRYAVNPVTGDYVPIESNEVILFGSSGEFHEETFSEMTIYVASNTSNKYHTEDCHWVGRIQEEKLIYFQTREEAEEQGLSPCSSCEIDS